MNEALWLDSPGRRLRVGPAPYTRPGAGEVVVRTRVIADNPVDTMNGVQRRLVYPWLDYPAIPGVDIGGEVVEVGPAVCRLSVGDRVVGLAIGQERHTNSPAHGAFQHYVVIRADLTSTIPPGVTCEQAVVLPLAVATASAGLFGRDHLALSLPEPGQRSRAETVVVWGGSTSVGCNAIQLARHAGYRVIATASPHNHPLVLDLGAAEAYDYRHPSVTAQILESLRHDRVAGILAIRAGSLTRAVRIAARVHTPKSATAAPVRIASVHPSPFTSVAGHIARLRGTVRISAIWGGSVAQDGLGDAIFTRMLPAGLSAGTYHPAPVAEAVGEGLGAIPDALARLSDGVSARKLVVTVPARAECRASGA